MGFLKNRVAIVTGGGRGIGKAIALAFSREGADVMISARTQREVEQVAQEVKEVGRKALPIVADVSSPQEVERMVSQTIQAFGKVDILVNNAGFLHIGPIAGFNNEIWNRTLAVNLTGTYLCSKAVLGEMVKHGDGRIINISSTAGRIGAAFYGAYAASKHGVIGLTKCLAQEVADKGITVNAICPGFIETSMARDEMNALARLKGIEPEMMRQIVIEGTPQKRILDPEEVAEIAVFLASEKSKGLTGLSIILSGGRVMD